MDDLIRVLPGILRAAGNSEEVAEAATMAVWRRVAGDGLRNHAVPFRLYRKTLVIAVADRTWQKQLESISGQLLFRLNSLLGQAVVTFIEFRIDPTTVRKGRVAEQLPKKTKADETGRALKCVSTDLRHAAAGIHDEELRRRFLLAAGSCLDRRQQDK